MTDAVDDNPDRGREHIEVLRETIDRNRHHDWEAYREQYRFTLVDDGTVRLSRKTGDTEPRTAIERSVDHVVTLDGGRAVGCNCHVAQHRFSRKSCRHMRAVEAHPRL